MYSHRVISFFLFTSLFFISSSLFAGLAWFIFSFHPSSSPSAINTPRKDSSVTEATQGGSKNVVKGDSHPDDDLTISHSVTSDSFPKLASRSPLSRTYPPVTELSTKEESRLGLRAGWQAESSISELEDDDASSITQIKEESTGGDLQNYEIESIERHPVSERSF